MEPTAVVIFTLFLVLGAVVWGMVWVVRVGNESPEQLVKLDRKRKAEEERHIDALMAAEAKLDAEGQKP